MGLLSPMRSVALAMANERPFGRLLGFLPLWDVFSFCWVPWSGGGGDLELPSRGFPH